MYRSSKSEEGLPLPGKLLPAAQGAHGIGYRDEADADIAHYRYPERELDEHAEGGEEHREQHYRDFDQQRTHYVLHGDAYDLFRMPSARDDARKIVVHDDNVRRFDGGIAAHAAHRASDVRRRKHGRVVYSVAAEYHFTVF